MQPVAVLYPNYLSNFCVSAFLTAVQISSINPINFLQNHIRYHIFKTREHTLMNLQIFF